LHRAFPNDKNSVSKAEDVLEASGLVQVTKYPDRVPRDPAPGQSAAQARTSVKALELSPEGVKFCRALTWTVATSELAVLRRAALDDATVAGSLLLLSYARQRGLPTHLSVNGEVTIEGMRVVVDMRDTPMPIAAWQASVTAQGFVAVCAASPQRRAQLVRALQAQPTPWPGRATDLQTLNSKAPPPEFWVQSWG
jgi:alpha-D-ribose 1-methylphosphonate 5-triphosphate synthase subunit PhnI